MLKYVVNASTKRKCALIRNVFSKKMNVPKHNLKVCHKISTRFISSSASYNVIFKDTENIHAYSVLNTISLSETLNAIKRTNSVIDSLDQFEAYLDRDWRSANISDIVQGFYDVLNYCVANNIDVSDKRFDKITDGLLDHVEDLSDEQLSSMLVCLQKFPPCESYRSHNFHDIWSALDDICKWKCSEPKQDFEKMLHFASLWYQLHLGKQCDTVFFVIDKCTRRSKFLSKTDLVHVFFYLNVLRRMPVDFNLEVVLERFVHELSVDELAVVALGYFKTKSKIKLQPIAEAMIDKLIEEHSTANEITIAAILKALRFSSVTKLDQKICHLLDKLTLEINRLNCISCLHVALLGTSLQILHEKSLFKVAEKFVKNIDNVNEVRLKDIERLLMVLTMFDIEPKTKPDIFEATLNELELDNRLPESVTFKRCVPCSLHFLSIRKLYSDKLLDRIMDKEYMKETYGKKNIPNEIFSLDCSIEIEHPNYKGKKLSVEERRSAVKYRIERIPTLNQYKKLTAAEKLLLDVKDTVKSIAGGDDYVHIDHILPHFVRADIIICKDKSTGNFTKISGFDSYVLGDIKRPHDLDRLKWYSIVALGWNNTIRGSSLPLGLMLMKRRQLSAIGYTTVFVPWCEYLLLPEDQKVEYVLNKINTS